MEDLLLSNTVSIVQYRQFEKDSDREKIADFVLKRFSERYIAPLRGDRRKKHGFCIMAVSCLMIEALESFWQGLPDTRGESKEVFRQFFQRCKKQGFKLGDFEPYADDFYYGIRCGILHQAETTRGWRIRRDGVLFDSATKTINAKRFHDEIELCLKDYCDQLRRADWEEEVWINLRGKMESIIKNCEPAIQLEFRVHLIRI